jgi:hypothetical protein
MRRNPFKAHGPRVWEDQKRESRLKRNPSFLLLKKIIEENCRMLFLASVFSIPHTLKRKKEAEIKFSNSCQEQADPGRRKGGGAVV